MSSVHTDARWAGRSRRLIHAPIALLSRPIVLGAYMPAVAIMNALMGMLLPMLMTPRVFGEYALASTLFQYGLIFDSGTGQLMDRWIPAALARKKSAQGERLGQELLWTRFYIAGAVFATAAVALVILSDRGALPFDLRVGLLSALAGTAYMIALGPGFIYRAHTARRNYAFAIGTLSLGLVIARPTGLLADGLIGCFTGLFVWYFSLGSFFFWRKPLPLRTRISLTKALSLAVKGLPLFATSFVWAFYLTANRWFASRLMEPSEFGHFAFSANIYSLLIGTIGGFNAFYYPRIAGLIANNDAYSLSRRIAVDCIKLILGISALAAIGILLADPLLVAIYPRYYSSVGTLRILLSALPAMVLVSWILPISLSAGRRPWIDGVFIYPTATVVLYAAIRTLFPRFGDDGVAGASIVSALLLIALLLLQLRSTRILTNFATAALLLTTGIVTACLSVLVYAVR